MVPCSFLPDLMAEDITQVSTRSGEAAERRMPKSREISTEIMEILQQVDLLIRVIVHSLTFCQYYRPLTCKQTLNLVQTMKKQGSFQHVP